MSAGLLHQQAAPGDLRVFRWLVFGLWCWRTALQSWAPLSELPLSVF